MLERFHQPMGFIREVSAPASQTNNPMVPVPIRKAKAPSAEWQGDDLAESGYHEERGTGGPHHRTVILASPSPGLAITPSTMPRITANSAKPPCQELRPDENLCFPLAVQKVLRDSCRGQQAEHCSKKTMKLRSMMTLGSAGILMASLSSVNAQPGGGMGMGMMGGMPGGGVLGGSTTKLFGENTAFSATMEVRLNAPGGGDPMSMPYKMSYDQGKSRIEMDMTEMKGGPMSPDAADQMKAMGMDKMVMISRPDSKTALVIYPGLRAYVENPMPEGSATAKPDDFKIEVTELGKETLDGHACLKNKAVVTEKGGTKHESTVWNATDLKKFPIKIESNEGGNAVTMTFKAVTLTKPDAKVFDAPTGYTKYGNLMEMMQQIMTSRMGGPGGVPAAPPPGR
jgi:hypothetical protein